MPGVTTANSEKAPLLVLAKGKKGVDDFGDADAAGWDYGWVYRVILTSTRSTRTSPGLGAETRDGPLVLKTTRGGLPLGSGRRRAARASSATRARTGASAGLEQQDEVAKKDGWKGPRYIGRSGVEERGLAPVGLGMPRQLHVRAVLAALASC